MALVQTLLTPLSRTGYSANGTAWTTGTTTVPANSTVVYIVSGCASSQAGVTAATFTLTTSAAGTPTAIGNSGASSNWGYGHRAWYVVNSTGSDISTTLTVGLTTNEIMGEWLVTPIQYTGIASSTPFTGFVTGIAAGNAAQTLTLAAAPASGDYTVGALMGIVNDGLTYTATVGSGYTQASTSSDTVTECYTSVQYRTGSTSTAAGWANTGHSGSTAPIEVQSIAFNVKAASASSPPVLTSGTTSNIQTTTATVGATTDTASGTMYAVVYTGTAPSATQIKAGQNSSGTTTPSANIAISSTGAKTLNITGLTANTAYNYSVIHNSTNGDSNIITGTLTTLAVPVLSSPTSASVTSSGATVGATTTVGAGTLYAVVYTTSQPSATQIKAGQDSSGTTAPSGTVAVSSTGAKTISISGLSASTAYNYALVQNDGSDSNVVTGTFTTSSGASPATLTSPTSSSVSATTATVGATTDTGSGTLYAVAYTGSQPSVTQIKLGQNSSGSATPSANITVSSTGAKTINLTGLSASTAYNYALVQNTTAGDSNIITGTFTTSAAGATPAPIGTATVFSISTGTTATGTRTVASGSALFLIIQNASAISSVQTGATNWSAVKSQINTDSASYRSSLYSLSNVAAGSLSVTITQASSGFMQCTIVEYSHMGSMTVAATAGNGVYGSNQGTGSTGTLPSGSNLVAIATWYAAAASGGTITAPSGWTNWTSLANPVYLVCGQVVSSTTALNPAWTYSAGNVENANLIGVFTPGAAPPAATLSSPSSNTVVSTSANVTCTSDTASGSVYAIVSTNSTTPTATQIEGGLDGTGATAAAAGSVSAASGTNSIHLTGLSTSTTYYYWLMQDNGSFSNVVGGSSFTTRPPGPVITTTNTSTPIVGGSITLTGTTFGSTQSTGSLVITDNLGGTATETGLTWANTSITAPTISLGTNILGTVYLTVTNSNGDASSGYAVTLGPQSGWTLVTIGTPNTTSSARLTATGGGDLASGDQIIYGNIQGTGSVTVNTDGTWVADSTVTSFDYAVGVAGSGYGSTGTETLNTVSATTTVVCIVWFD